jgi:hypothetical protein
LSGCVLVLAIFYSFFSLAEKKEIRMFAKKEIRKNWIYFLLKIYTKQNKKQKVARGENGKTGFTAFFNLFF